MQNFITSCAGGILMMAVVAMGSGCASKSGGGPSGAIEAPQPTQAMAVASGTDMDTLGRGYSAYLKQCAQCHVSKLPDDLSRASWHKMTWNVGMEKVDEQALVQYLLAEIKTR
jgi:mono/diheme cytochrome c family protein